MIIETRNSAGQDMGFSELVEMYGEDVGMGLSLKSISRGVKKVGKVVAKPIVKVAKVAARNPAAIATGGLSLLAPKSMQANLNSTARAAATGGISLVATKSGRNLVGQSARVTQKSVLRPTAHLTATAARNPLVQKAAGTAARAGLAYVTGGASEAALMTAQNARSFLPKSLPKSRPAAAPAAVRTAPVRTAPARAAAGSIGRKLPENAFRMPFRRPAAAPAPATAEPAAAGFPVLPVALGGLGLVALLALTMGRKK